ncbi:MAG: hypothetical protein JXB10_06220 [Pirellulales bacterium]|nr:hypothetical protein [Pirellulales bacterium]
MAGFSVYWLAAVVGLVAPEARRPDAVAVFRCNFDQASDSDFDGWPDGWSRQRGPGYPAYQKIQIQSAASGPGRSCLQIELAGGAAAVFSPPLPIDRFSSYVLEGRLEMQGTKYDRAYLSLRFFDEAKQPLAEFSSAAFTETKGWRKVRLGPVTALSPEARWVVIGLHVEPGEKADLQGSVAFTDLRLDRVPRLVLEADHPQHIYPLPDLPEVTCTAGGLDGKVPEVQFELLDVFGGILGQQTLRMSKVEGRVSMLEERSAINDPRPSTLDPRPSDLTFSANWRPPISGPGFYRVRASLKGRTAIIRREELELAVFVPQAPPPQSEFGWSLPDGERPLALAPLTALVTQAGIHWLKFPLWSTEQSAERTWEKGMTLSGQLNEHGMELIGMLNQPPELLRARFRRGRSPFSGRRRAASVDQKENVPFDSGTMGREDLTAAEIFGGKTSLWYPSLEPLLARIAIRIPYWQLGRDTDDSLLTMPNAPEKLAEIQAQFHKAAPEIQVAVGWDWIRALPEESDIALPFRAVSLSARPPLTAAALAEYLDASRNTPLRRWTVIAPLPKDEYPLRMRAEDLFQRMLASKIHGADAAFCPDPFDARCGLMNPDGTPGPLLLPWRTTGLEIGGKDFLGRLTLPGGSRNAVFARDGRVVLVVWSDRPGEEVLPFSQELSAVDLWGRQAPIEKTGEGFRLRVGSLPVFVHGLSESVARWSLGLRLDQKRLATRLDRPQPFRMTVANSFPGGVEGVARLGLPEGWKADPKSLSLNLSPGETWRSAFDVTLPYSVDSGRHNLQIDFDLQTDPPCKFSVLRPVEVGSGDVALEVSTRLNERDQLEVEQRLINRTPGEVSFDCALYAPDRRRSSAQVLDLGQGADAKVYRLEGGRDLLGKTLWLHAEQAGGPRVLNYHFPATP